MADAAVSLAFSPEGRHLAANSASHWNGDEWQGTLACFDVGTGQLVWANGIENGFHVDLPLPEDFANGFFAEVVWSPDGKRLFLGSAAGALIVFDAASGETPGILQTSTLLPLEELAIDERQGVVWAFGQKAGLRSAGLNMVPEPVEVEEEEEQDE